jgi:hypothetical protein
MTNKKKPAANSAFILPPRRVSPAGLQRSEDAAVGLAD